MTYALVLVPVGLVLLVVVWALAFRSKPVELALKDGSSAPTSPPAPVQAAAPPTEMLDADAREDDSDAPTAHGQRPLPPVEEAEPEDLSDEPTERPSLPPVPAPDELAEEPTADTVPDTPSASPPEPSEAPTGPTEGDPEVVLPDAAVPDAETLLNALGFDMVAPRTGSAPVIVVDVPEFPGMCYEDDHVIEIQEGELLGPNAVMMQEASNGPMIIVRRKDPKWPAAVDNFEKVGVLFACASWNFPNVEVGHRINGFCLESADVTIHEAGDGFRADYVMHEWMPTINANKGRMDAIAEKIGVPAPGNHAMWLAAFGYRAGLRQNGIQGLQDVLEAGPAAALDLIEELGASLLRPPGPETSEALVEAYRNGAVASLARQLALQNFVDGRSWNIDLREEVFTLGKGDAQARFTLHILGSVDPGGNSFMWSWGNTGMQFPEHLVAAARALQEHDIPEMRARLFPIDEDSMYMLFVAQSTLDGRPYFYGKAPTGGPGVLVLLDQELEIDNLTLIRAVTEFPLLGPPIPDHANALTSGFDMLGFEWTREGDVFEVTTHKGIVRIELNEQGFLKSAEGQA